MKSRALRWTAAGALIVATLAGRTAAAQSLAERVLGAAATEVRMSYAARPGVCGNGGTFYRIDGDGDGNWSGTCEAGPVRVQFTRNSTGIVGIRVYVGGRWLARDGVTDLGDIAPADASEFLLSLATTAPASVAEDAIMPAAIADTPDPWERLLEIASDRSLARDVREAAVFWVGQSAARAATSGLTALVESDAEATSLRKAAVFALSQRDEPERIDELIRIGRTHSNPEVVKAAFFWLADSADPRALALFEEVLSSR